MLISRRSTNAPQETSGVCPWCGLGGDEAGAAALVVCATCRAQLDPEVIAALSSDDDDEVTSEYEMVAEGSQTFRLERRERD